RGGYAVLERRWRAGDVVKVTLPMAVAAHPTPGDASTVAFTYGPLVLAADMGPADAQFEGVGPALVTAAAATGALAPAGGAGQFRAVGALNEALTFKPFFSQYDRRAAVYFPTFTPAGWAGAKAGYVQAQEEARALARRTSDIIHLGEMQPERDHQFQSDHSEVVNWSGRSARRLRPGESMRMVLARRPGAAVLRVLVARGDVDRKMGISVDGQALGAGRRVEGGEGHFAAIDYAVPGNGAGTPADVVVTALRDDAVLYEIRMMTLPAGIVDTAMRS
ncbi:DUF6805 domain-containing protein, partial [uncultured Sphingomonas sp.]|uniref:DUF6805 domain-containing protein n=1 Tax=uncultured Sphingomonas sp. TaxID=158754 RepID=UPI00262180DA